MSKVPTWRIHVRIARQEHIQRHLQRSHATATWCQPAPRTSGAAGEANSQQADAALLWLRVSRPRARTSDDRASAEPATHTSRRDRLPTSIGGTALLVFVAKMRGPDGLLWITWAGGGFSLVEVVVVGAIILLGDWPRYAREAKARQEARPS